MRLCCCLVSALAFCCFWQNVAAVNFICSMFPNLKKCTDTLSVEGRVSEVGHSLPTISARSSPATSDPLAMVSSVIGTTTSMPVPSVASCCFECSLDSSGTVCCEGKESWCQIASCLPNTPSSSPSTSTTKKMKTIAENSTTAVTKFSEANHRTSSNSRTTANATSTIEKTLKIATTNKKNSDIASSMNTETHRFPSTQQASMVTNSVSLNSSTNTPEHPTSAATFGFSSTLFSTLTKFGISDLPPSATSANSLKSSKMLILDSTRASGRMSKKMTELSSAAQISVTSNSDTTMFAPQTLTTAFDVNIKYLTKYTSVFKSASAHTSAARNFQPSESPKTKTSFSTLSHFLTTRQSLAKVTTQESIASSSTWSTGAKDSGIFPNPITAGSASDNNFITSTMSSTGSSTLVQGRTNSPIPSTFSTKKADKTFSETTNFLRLLTLKLGNTTETDDAKVALKTSESLVDQSVWFSSRNISIPTTLFTEKSDSTKANDVLTPETTLAARNTDKESVTLSMVSLLTSDRSKTASGSTASVTVLSECRQPCPPDWIETSAFCLFWLDPPQPRGWLYADFERVCRDFGAIVAPLRTFDDAADRAILHKLRPTDGNSLIYTNAIRTKEYREGGGIPTLDVTASSFIELISFPLKELGHVTSVFAICRREKFCKPIACHVNEFLKAESAKGLQTSSLVPDLIPLNGKLAVECTATGVRTEVVCSLFGDLQPDSSMIDCEPLQPPEEKMPNGPVASCDECHHASSCVPSLNTSGFTCVCAEFYVGRTCRELVDRCHNVTCANDGRCANLVTDYGCVCRVGFFGRHCELPLNGNAPEVLALRVPSRLGAGVVGLLAVLRVAGTFDGKNPHQFFLSTSSTLAGFAFFVVALGDVPESPDSRSWQSCTAVFLCSHVCLFGAMAAAVLQSVVDWGVLGLRWRNRWHGTCELKNRSFVTSIPSALIVFALLTLMPAGLLAVFYLSYLGTARSCIGSFGVVGTVSRHGTQGPGFVVLSFLFLYGTTAVAFALAARVWLDASGPKHLRRLCALEAGPVEYAHCVRPVERGVKRGHSLLHPVLLMATWISQVWSLDSMTVWSTSLTTVVAFAFSAHAWLQTLPLCIEEEQPSSKDPFPMPQALEDFVTERWIEGYLRMRQTGVSQIKSANGIGLDVVRHRLWLGAFGPISLLWLWHRWKKETIANDFLNPSDPKHQTELRRAIALLQPPPTQRLLLTQVTVPPHGHIVKVTCALRNFCAEQRIEARHHLTQLSKFFPKNELDLLVRRDSPWAEIESVHHIPGVSKHILPGAVVDKFNEEAWQLLTLRSHIETFNRAAHDRLT